MLGQKIVGLLDSGANSTILGKNALELIKNLNLQQFPLISFIKTADGRSHRISSFVILPILYNKILHKVETLVVPSLTKPLILGMDFWKLYNIRPVICSQIDSVPISDAIHLSDSKLKQLKAVQMSFLIGTSDQPLGRTNVISHDIDTGKTQPFKQRYYCVSPYIQVEMDKELNRMLSLDVIEPCASPWSNPIVAIRRPNKKMRLCLDSRKLNQVSVPCRYPLPYISRILGRIRGTKYLSTIDLKDAFWQVPLTPGSRPKTAFTVPGRGMYQFKVMPFGLQNAPGTQSRLMDAVLGHDLEPLVFCYLDDIVCATETFEEHIYCLKRIAERLRKANLTISLEKSKFCVRELKYLGFVLGEHGLRTDLDKVASILHFPIPKNIKGVRSLCGMLSWYRKFIDEYASLAAPITDLTKKSTKPFVWTDEADKALSALKILLTSAPILAMPDFSKEFIMECDSSNTGVGGVLLQNIDGVERVIEYMSQRLSDTQIKYSVTEKECLAVVLCIEKWRSYIEGAKFTVVTDHASLRWLQNLKDPAGRLARWALRLQPYNFTLVHRKGVNHVVPDALSRSIETIDVENEDFMSDLEYNSLRDDIIVFPEKYPKYYVKESLIYIKLNNGWKLLVPKNLREKLLNHFHDDEISAHQGNYRTAQRLREKFWWKTLLSDVKRYVAQCETCLKCKYPNVPLRAPMGHPKLPNTPWRFIACDFMGPFPRTSNQNTNLLVVTDIFSKFSLLKPLRNAKTNLMIKFLEDEIFMVYGVPEIILTDNATIFKSKQFKLFCAKYGVAPWKSAVYHAQNNPVERVNLSLGSAIRSYIGENHRDWDKNISRIGCALRTAVHGTTKYTPFYLNFGHQMSTVGTSYKIADTINDLDNKGFETHCEEFFQARIHAVENMKSSHERNTKYYNLRSRSNKFNVGDIVYKRNFVLSNAAKSFCEKFAYLFVPAKIVEKLGNSCYRLSDEKGKDLGIYSAKDIKPKSS